MNQAQQLLEQINQYKPPMAIEDATNIVDFLNNPNSDTCRLFLQSITEHFNRKTQMPKYPTSRDGGLQFIDNEIFSNLINSFVPNDFRQENFLLTIFHSSTMREIFLPFEKHKEYKISPLFSEAGEQSLINYFISPYYMPKNYTLGQNMMMLDCIVRNNMAPYSQSRFSRDSGVDSWEKSLKNSLSGHIEAIKQKCLSSSASLTNKIEGLILQNKKIIDTDTSLDIKYLDTLKKCIYSCAELYEGELMGKSNDFYTYLSLAMAEISFIIDLKAKRKNDSAEISEMFKYINTNFSNFYSKAAMDLNDIVSTIILFDDYWFPRQSGGELQNMLSEFKLLDLSQEIASNNILKEKLELTGAIQVNKTIDTVKVNKV